MSFEEDLKSVANKKLNDFYVLDYAEQSGEPSGREKLEDYFEKIGLQVPGVKGRIAFSTGILVGVEIALEVFKQQS